MTDHRSPQRVLAQELLRLRQCSAACLLAYAEEATGCRCVCRGDHHGILKDAPIETAQGFVTGAEVAVLPVLPADSWHERMGLGSARTITAITAIRSIPELNLMWRHNKAAGQPSVWVARSRAGRWGGYSDAYCVRSKWPLSRQTHRVRSAFLASLIAAGVARSVWGTRDTSDLDDGRTDADCAGADGLRSEVEARAVAFILLELLFEHREAAECAVRQLRPAVKRRCPPLKMGPAFKRLLEAV